MRVTKSQLFLVLHLIGREKGARFLDQSHTKSKKLSKTDAILVYFLLLL